MSMSLCKVKEIECDAAAISSCMAILGLLCTWLYFKNLIIIISSARSQAYLQLLIYYLQLHVGYRPSLLKCSRQSVTC